MGEASVILKKKKNRAADEKAKSRVDRTKSPLFLILFICELIK